MFVEGTTAQAAAGTVEVAIERIKQIANTQVAAMADLTRQEQQAFSGLDLSPAAFGEVPEAQDLGEQHRAAHQVFVSTVAGVLADLEDFRTQLLASAQVHETTDEASYAALAALGTRYQQQGFRSEQNYEQERSQQGDALRGVDADPQTSGEPSTPAAGGDAGVSTAATPTSSGGDAATGSSDGGDTAFSGGTT